MLDQTTWVSVVGCNHRHTSLHKSYIFNHDHYRQGWIRIRVKGALSLGSPHQYRNLRLTGCRPPYRGVIHIEGVVVREKRNEVVGRTSTHSHLSSKQPDGTTKNPPQIVGCSVSYARYLKERLCVLWSRGGRKGTCFSL